MKALMSLLGEPVVHLVVIGLVALRVVWGFGAEPAAAEAARSKPACLRCEQPHDSRHDCPEVVAHGQAPELD